MVGFVAVSPVITAVFISRRRSRLVTPAPLDVTRLTVSMWLVCLAFLTIDTIADPAFLLAALVIAPATALALAVQVMFIAWNTHTELRLLGHTFGRRHDRLPR